jgi:hypothetical protein
VGEGGKRKIEKKEVRWEREGRGSRSRRCRIKGKKKKQRE